MVRRDDIERKVTVNLESSETEKKFLHDFEANLAENLEKYNLENKKKESLIAENKKIVESTKKSVLRDKIIKVIKQEVAEFNQIIYQKSVDFRDNHIYSVDGFAELEKKIKAGVKGLFLISFCNRLECEVKIKEKTPAYSIRCISEKEKIVSAKSCLFCQLPAQNIVYLGRSY